MIDMFYMERNNFEIIISKGNNRYRFYALYLLMLLLLFFNYALLIPISPMVYVVILACAVFLGDRDEIIAVCICCIPLFTAIDSHYVIISCIAVLFFKYGKNIKLDMGIIPIILIMIWEFLHCIDGETNIKIIIGFVLIYLFFIMLFSLRDMRTIDYGFIMRNYAITVFFVSCILLMRLLIHNNFNLDMVFLNMQRLGVADEEIGGMIINPNSLGVQCVLAVGCLMQSRSSGQKRRIDILLMISILVFGTLTCSRTYLACLLILGVFLFMVSDIGINRRLKLLLSSVVVLLMSVLLIYLVFPTVLEMFLQRLTAEDITGGRFSLFVAYNNYIFSSAKSILWGLGSSSLGSKVMTMSIANDVPHNGIQEILVAWGIIGLILFTAMILALIQRSKQENIHQSRTNYSLLVVIFAKIMVGQVITSSYTMLAFALVYLSLCWDLSAPKELEKSL